MISVKLFDTPRTISALHVIEWILEDTALDTNVATLLLYPIDAYRYHNGVTNEIDRDCVVRYTYRFDDEQHDFVTNLNAAASTFQGECGLLSQIEIGIEGEQGNTYKVPFIDLELPNDAHALEYLKEAITKVPPPFEQLYLVCSGESFHLYGDRLVRAAPWSCFLSTALTWQYRDANNQQQYLVDVRWVGQTLGRGIGTIRVEARKKTECSEARPLPLLYASITDA